MQRLHSCPSALLGALLLTGCSLRQVGNERVIGALFLVIGLVALGWSRRGRG